MTFISPGHLFIDTSSAMILLYAWLTSLSCVVKGLLIFFFTGQGWESRDFHTWLFSSSQEHLLLRIVIEILDISLATSGDPQVSTEFYIYIRHNIYAYWEDVVKEAKAWSSFCI